MVVDDSAIIRKIMSKMLDNVNVSYHICKDGFEALQWFQEHVEVCAAIITDLEMPKMGGDVLILQARQINPQLPCYVVSGTDIGAVNLPSGARMAVIKPLSSEKIVEILEDICSLQEDGAYK